ncbi:MAG TPA: MarR family transcriptional regulator [Chloroflexi bacterium]|nr:MarR family transcriptional regulator [Chloroflexota bacterium]HPO58194.1 MarR family transcriptional regulator [Anaerolineaceae bacterium]
MINELDPRLEQDVHQFEELYMRLSWFTRRRFEQELARFRITVPQFIALRCLLDHPDGCSMSHMAAALHQVMPTMSGIVDRLVEAGLASRELDPSDRRALRVKITPKGEQLVEEIRAFKRGWFRQLMVEISPSERSAALELLRKYLSVIENRQIAAIDEEVNV